MSLVLTLVIVSPLLGFIAMYLIAARIAGEG
jgi:hypothetical protein